MHSLFSRSVIFCFLIALLESSVVGSNENQDKQASGESASEIQWWKGDVSKALETAKSERKYLFVYWGAVWCPPCNEMKANVFPKTEFQEVISSMIPVMIDGDSKDAQKWSETLGATGYPTLMVLDPDGTQRARFVGYTPFETITGAIKSVRTSAFSMNTLAARAAESAPLTSDEWRILSFGDWSSFKAADLGGKDPSEVALLALDKMPPQLKSEKAILATFALNTAEQAPPETQKRIKESFDKLLGYMSSADDVRMSIVDFLSWGAPALKWSLVDIPTDQQKARVETWAKLIEQMAAKSSSALPERLNIAAARAGIMPLQPTNAQLTLKQTKDLKALEGEIFKLKNQHQLTSMVPKLADAYASIGDSQRAIKILQRAAADSAVPYYYFSHIASLYEDANDSQKAVVWREKAMLAAKGSSTRIQWSWSYLNGVQNSTVKDKEVRLEKGIVDLLKRGMEAGDGFNGRNRRYLEKTSELIGKLPNKSQKLVATLELYQRQCDSLKDEQRMAACKAYFSNMSFKEAPQVEPGEATKPQ